MEKIKVSVVSYTNSKPFIYGITHNKVREDIDLCLDIPADCANKLIDNQVDIGLIPVAAIPLVPNAKIIGSCCIGSVGAVNSVFIFSNKPIAEIKTIKLDPQSRTSNNLAKVLCKFFYQINVEFVTAQNLETDAIVLIGDRTFGKQLNFPFVYDMGEEWFKFTGLPFVYAAWVANKEISSAFIDQFDEALNDGLAHLEEVLKEITPIPNFDIQDYFYHKLSFELNDKKREAINLFLNYIQKLEMK